MTGRGALRLAQTHPPVPVYDGPVYLGIVYPGGGWSCASCLTDGSDGEPGLRLHGRFCGGEAS